MLQESGSVATRRPVNSPDFASAGTALPAATSASHETRLAASQSIVYTASLTLQVRNADTAAVQAGDIVTASGGYTAGEQESSRRGQRAADVSLQLKIPATNYPATLGKLAALGTIKSLSKRATDVTQQVADVGSRVISAQAAITQLRALLRRAGSVAGLLSVQDQINSQEASLEALLAQQRTLAKQTSYATVSLLLQSHHPKAVNAKKKSTGLRPAFQLAGARSGWRSPGCSPHSAWCFRLP